MDDATGSVQFICASLTVSTIRTKLWWNKFSDKKNKKEMNKSSFCYLQVLTLEVSTMHTGGIVTFANAHRPQLRLHIYVKVYV